MASILIREADANGVKRFRAVQEGQGIRTGHVKGPFYYRPVVDGRQLPPKRLKSATFAEAKAEADNLPNKIVAQEMGVQPEQLRGNRVPIVTAVQKYLEQKSSKAPRTLAQYRTTLEQFTSIIKSKAHFLDEIDEDVLRHYKKALEAEGYAGKTIDTRLNIVFFLLKKNGIKARIPADEMPTVIARQKFRSDHDFGDREEGRRTSLCVMHAHPLNDFVLVTGHHLCVYLN